MTTQSLWPWSLFGEFGLDGGLLADRALLDASYLGVESLED